MAVFAIGALFPGLSLDVALSHFVSGSGEAVAQWVPVWFGALAGLVLMALSSKSSSGLLRLGSRIIGGMSIAIGVVGTALHAIPLWEATGDGGFTWSAFVEALSLHAPPLLAPGAYALLGLALVAVVCPRLEMSIVDGLAGDRD